MVGRSLGRNQGKRRVNAVLLHVAVLTLADDIEIGAKTSGLLDVRRMPKSSSSFQGASATTATSDDLSEQIPSSAAQRTYSTRPTR